nr:MAG TPA: hypothetical protein [Caudoviricetes sp.]
MLYYDWYMYIRLCKDVYYYRVIMLGRWGGQLHRRRILFL